MDFEPWEAGIMFEVATDLNTGGYVSPEDLSAYQTGLFAGIREELCGPAVGMPAAVAVVLRSVRVHEVDSHPRAFQAAGRLTVRKALAVLYGPPARPKRRRA